MAIGENSRRKWTQADDERLENYWGRANVKWIASVLGRTTRSTKHRACKLGLGRFADADGIMTFQQLLDALGISRKSYSSQKEKLVKAGIPVYAKKILERSVLKIDLKDFWKWAEKNKDLINWGKVEINILGKEPAWVQERRKVDFYNYKNFHKEWSLNDDEALTHYVIDLGLTITEIAVKTGRSEGAIRHRCKELFLPLPKTKPYKKWTLEETLLAIELRKQGYSFGTIARKLSRSETSVIGRLRDYVKQNGGVENKKHFTN